MSTPQPCCAWGFAPHSGWAAVVMLAGTAAEPQLLVRERIELAAADLAGARQPYHALEGVPLEEARRRLAQLEASAVALAAQAVGALAARARSAGVEPRAAGILDAGARRSAAPLEAVLASHALIHAADGNHFRSALAQACATHGLAVTRVPQRTLLARAAAELGKSPAQLRATVSALGRGCGAPWGADQKSAALLAWLLLAQPADVSGR